MFPENALSLMIISTIILGYIIKLKLTTKG